MNTPETLRKEAWRRLLGGVFFRVLIIALILYTVCHCVIAISPRMTTAVAAVGEESVVTEGVATIYRDERILTSDGWGLLVSYPLENGAKVSATSELVTLYTTTLDAAALEDLQRQITVLDARIVAAKRAQRQYPYATSITTTASLGAVHTDIREHMLALSRATQGAGSFSIPSDIMAELALSLSAYADLSDAEAAAGTPLEALEGRRAALISTVARSMRTMTLRELTPGQTDEQGFTTFSGYFYHADAVDGYENIFSRAALDTMSIMEYDAMQAAAPAQYAGGTLLGKTVGSYAWSITLPVSFAVADTLTVGQTYEVSFPEEQNTTVAMTLDRVIRSVAEERAVLVLSADVMPQDFRFTRFQTARLILEKVQGYCIPDTALQLDTDADAPCVYVLKDGSVRRRDVHVLLHGEGYAIVAGPDEQGDGGLRLHDVVITSGKDLYDGKYID
jgi:multidrug efflux pump subunit AcrA (membrane-fusion protein)